ncbi:Slam-dependent surface lipoprotein [Glaesserella sp.]|uniref:Slam-dependent surface lipoprotein n=1 Tax=Glaesserella sp. TaxID=2094731 RepID=UPI0035A05DB1
MKTFKLISLMASTIFITACGGGGSGNAHTPDGDKINLTLSPKGIIELYTEEGRLFGRNSNHSFYGVWLRDDATQKDYRYQGTKATSHDIPKAGVYTYIGEAVWMDGANHFKHGGITTLYVDFEEKKVNGSILFSDERSRKDISLNRGTLSGVDFNGTATSDGINGNYEGALFGPSAKEAAGFVRFESNPNLNVAFGGQKQ